MPPRASWRGSLKLSLVTFPVRLYNAVSTTTRIQLNQLHKKDFRRIRYQLTCPEHGPIEREEIVRGYEYEKGRFVVLEDEDLERVRLETTKSIELTQFVGSDEVPDLYLETAYYVAPDGRIAEDAFRVIREAMAREGKVGIGRVVMSGREVIVALAPFEKGFVLHTLHYAHEVRSAGPYFEELPEKTVDDAELSLATELIRRNTAPFDPAQFTDRYQTALLEVVKGKVKGEVAIVESPPHESAKVINLMDALKRSVAESTGRKPPAPSVRPEGAPRRQRPRKST
jgi:DNA end-binding protein Ku